jgi:nitrile hydratase
MNGVHDLGGMHGFGPVTAEVNEPVFHADWERRTFALALATMGTGRVNVDEFRRTIERMPPAEYLASSYYEHWLYAIEQLLIEKEIVEKGEIDARIEDRTPAAEASTSPPPAVDQLGSDGALWSDPQVDVSRPSSAVALRHNPKFKARFKPGEHVVARNLNPTGHTRSPRYVRGHRGIIRHDWGTFVFPDSHAHGAGARPQHCYSVEFTARELWGDAAPARERICVDLWEAYLAPDTARAEQAKPAARAVASRKIAQPPRVAIQTREVKSKRPKTSAKVVTPAKKKSSTNAKTMTSRPPRIGPKVKPTSARGRARKGR